MSYSIGFLLIIAMGFYFIYGNPFSAQQVDLAQYQLVCDQYQQAEEGEFKEAELQMLVNEINYLVQDELTAIQDPAAKKLKMCAQQLTEKMNKGK